MDNITVFWDREKSGRIISSASSHTPRPIPAYGRRTVRPALAGKAPGLGHALWRLAPECLDVPGLGRSFSRGAFSAGLAALRPASRHPSLSDRLPEAAAGWTAASSTVRLIFPGQRARPWFSLRPRGRAPGQGRLGPGRDAAPDRAPVLRAFGRPEAAGAHCPGPGLRAGPAHPRRTHGQHRSPGEILPLRGPGPGGAGRDHAGGQPRPQHPGRRGHGRGLRQRPPAP